MNQIDRIKYNKAIKLFKAHKRQHSPNQINLFLKAEGLNEKEISLFWKSTSELRVHLSCFESEQKFLHGNLDDFFEE
jgi:hypothetical protein